MTVFSIWIILVKLYIFGIIVIYIGMFSFIVPVNYNWIQITDNDNRCIEIIQNKTCVIHVWKKIKIKVFKSTFPNIIQVRNDSYYTIIKTLCLSG